MNRNGAVASATEIKKNQQGVEQPYTKHDSDPVNTATGNYFFSRNDLSVKGTGMDFTWSRFYNSTAAATDSPLGFGWSHGYNHTLSDAGAEVTVIRADGSTSVFTRGATENGDTFYDSKIGEAKETLLKSADGNYVFGHSNGTELIFNPTGKVIRTTDRNQNSMVFTLPPATWHQSRTRWEGPMP